MNAAQCESCLTCATVQGQERRQNPALHSIPVEEPFPFIGMDFKEMDKSFDDNWYALDYLTKWPKVIHNATDLSKGLIEP